MVTSDPGECPVCGAAHTACTAGSRRTQVTIVMTPARDALPVVYEPTIAEQVQATLPPGQTTTGTYRGQTKKR